MAIEPPQPPRDRGLSGCEGRTSGRLTVPPPTQAGRLSGTFPQAALILFASAVTIPLAALFVANRAADDFIAERLSQPELEHRFGFVAARLPEWRGSSQNTPLRIVAVIPKGPFDRAGVQPGDIPAIGFLHGYHADAFFNGLLRAGENPVYLVFLRGPALKPTAVWVGVPPR